MATSPVTLDFSKAQPISQPVTLDMSKATPIQAAQPGTLDPHDNWTDYLRGGANAIKQIVMHPIDSASSMVQGAMASGMSASGEGYPSTAATGRPVDSANNAAVQADAQQGQVAAGQFARQHPQYAAGSIAGPALVTAGAVKMAPMLGEAGIDTAGRMALLGKTPEGAYESALKPSTTISPADRAAMVQTGLDQGIPVSKGGVEKIGALIDGLNQSIKAEIASDPTRPIDPNAVATRTTATSAKFANQVNAQPDLNAIEASKQQFLAEQGAKPGTPAIPPKPTGLLDARGNPIMDAGTPAKPPTPAPPMNAADAQSMKQGTYQVLRGKYGEQGSASVEAQKALARGLKEEIANQFPEINNLNAQESKLFDLQPALERAVNRVANHQLIGIGTPVAGAAAEAVTGSSGAGAVASVLKAVLDNPNVKSRLAIAVSHAQKIPLGSASAKVQAYSSALGAGAGVSNVGTPSQSDQPQP
jgi:hypothetical protein